MTIDVARVKEKMTRSRFWNSRKPEYLVILAYLVWYCVITAFHEPWFDEAQSWQIAKCESISRLIFHIPHYEGNPPLWYLILALPAKMGIPFEWGLKTTGLIISISYILLLVLRSPLPRPARLTIPFTYFMFYQYGVIVRPYGLMFLAFMLAAMAFKTRNEQPYKFVLSLAFLCETSSFCVVIAGGIAACWLYEILREDALLKVIVRDSRIHGLLALLVFALALAATILPPPDASFTSFLEGQNSVLKCFLIAITTALSETLMTTSSWFSYETHTLAAANIATGSLISCIAVQTIIITHIFSFSNSNNFKYFVVPYCFYCLFGAFVVLAGHYLGIGFGILLFWMWISFDDAQQFELGRKLAGWIHFGVKDIALLKKFSILFCILSVGISFYWTVASSKKEIQYQYSYGRETTRLLEETGLVNAKIAMAWDEGTTKTGGIDYEKMDTRSNGWPVPLCAYVGRNIVYNFNNGLDDAAYVKFIKSTEEENRYTIESWKNEGIPDVLLGEADVALLTEGAVSIKDYSPVYTMKTNYIWKGRSNRSGQYLFVRNDLLDKYSLTPIERPDGFFGNASFEITDEMRERVKNGEDINDILKPYLDYMFGEESGK